jgi:4-hydroxythreonine-4-phosphate dehydrogenase
MPQSLALTIGEPAGIGPDIALLAWQQRVALQLPPFYILADPDFLARRAQQLGLEAHLRIVDPSAASAVFATSLPVVPLKLSVTAEPGRPDASSAAAAIAAIRRAVADVNDGRASAVVTNPVSKAVLYRAGFADPGQTEFLARLTEELTGARRRPVMMLWSPELAVIPVTTHVPLRSVPDRLSTVLVVETARIAAHDLVERFAIPRPRLAVAALNPHGGENGTIGVEDRTIIAPAVEELRREGLDVSGPFSADSLFHRDARANYDAVLCMYHDQALIPVKTIAFEHAVNVTLGLPFVRTSPDHGTAFDIAGTGRANPTSLVAALRLAHRLTARVDVAMALN